MIEDNPTNLQLMVYLLSACGHEVLEAYEGTDGLQKAKSDAPDLVLLDIHMPQMDGYEVARRLRADPQCSKIPLVAVTALAMVGDRERILASGFDGYIAKPIDAEGFLLQIGRIISAPARPTARTPAADGGDPASDSIPSQRHSVALVVDNMEINVDLVRSILEPNGFEVIAAASAKDGLDVACRRKPDLIISDIHMPHTDGYAFREMVRSRPELSSIPFVFVSSSVWSHGEEERAARLGAKYIARPIEPDLLLKQLEACMINRRSV